MIEENDYTPEDIEIGRALWDVADDDGIVTAEAMVRMTSQPEMHTTFTLELAFRRLTGKDFDMEFFK